MSDEYVAPPPQMTFADILYTIFRHKWKILLIIALGIVAVFALPLLKPIPYQSQARLYIRYVVDTQTPSQVGENDPRIKAPDRQYDNVISTELEILTSMDLAQRVADIIGPERLLAKVGGGTNRYDAAAIIQGNLVAEVARNSSVIRLIYRHPDPEIVQPVLAQLIGSYFKKHGEIHAVGAFDEFLTQETDQLRSRLVQTEEQLRNAKVKAGVTTLDETKKACGERVSRIQQLIFDAEAELAGREGAVEELTKHLQTSAPLATNNKVSAIRDLEVPTDKATEYRTVGGLLESLRRREQELLMQFTPENVLVKGVREQIAANEKARRKLEEETPGLRGVGVAEQGTTAADPTASRRAELIAEMARVRDLKSRIQKLGEQLVETRKDLAVVNEAEALITELQRRRDLEEAHYKHFSENLELSKIEEKLGAGKVSNISIIQAPSPPTPGPSKLHKMRGLVLVGSIFGAIALAFLIDLYLDQSLKRPIEVEAKLGLPLFISIPRLNPNGKPHRLKSKRPVPLLVQGTGGGASGNGRGEVSDLPTHSTEICPWDPSHKLRPFFDALRDRLITFFEAKNLTHKPKLVALTSCSEGCGVSTVAAGLAAAMSETGEGNVLLVDMNMRNGAARRFYNGDLACGLDQALEADKRSEALIQDNLYVVTETADRPNEPRVLPNRFKNLLPRLKASDYDYIIFDMPPVSQASMTPRLAQFMDMVLMVVESEKTDRHLIKSASSLLMSSKTNVGVVLNKRRDYIPRRLRQEV